MKPCLSVLIPILLFATLFFAACGGGSGGGGTPPPPATYTIGGTVSGLAGTGLVLQDNGGNDLSISTNGNFAFTNSVSSGAAYNVTVSTEPSNPAQTCNITNGSGTASANVTNVQVACTTNPTHNVWIWMGGANVVNQFGTYGTEGTAAPGNVPGARDSSAAWTDATGNFWLFGGTGLAASPSQGSLSDLWEYSNGQWAWMNGSNQADQAAVYGTQGTAAPGNTPGARLQTATWIDAAGNLWLFGGKAGGNLSDLWEYSGGQWTWMGGPDTQNQPGVYGTKGTPAPTNIPGARQHSLSWIDKSGNFWLFGGVGYDSAGSYSTLNDLWEYSGGQWTWVNGSDTINSLGTYGTRGTASPANVPGARSTGVSWIDAAGNFWLFGGGGYGSSGTLGFLNDLWEFSNGEWTWMGGPKIVNQNPVYGTEGTASASNIPGGRIQSVAWVDASGNFWLFSGYGIDSGAGQGQLNDLWKYSAGQWTWVNGSNVGDQTGIYGTQGVPATTNVPGARQGAVVWVDTAGNFWFFTGNGYDSNGNSNELNDLWEYQP